MLSKSKLRTWIKRNKFKLPRGYSTRDKRSLLKYGGCTVKRNNRYYRFRNNEHQFSGGEKRWVVDISCRLDDFDRWANSTEDHAVEFDEFMKRY